MIITKLNPFVTEFLPTNSVTPIIVDSEDFGKIKELNTDWCVHFKNDKPQAINSTKTFRGRIVNLARFLIPTKSSYDLRDHKDRNIFNNKKDNIRICSYSQNQCNTTKRKDNTTGYKNIVINRGKYNVQIQKQHKRKSYGTFTSIEEAVEVRDKILKELHGEFASLK